MECVVAVPIGVLAKEKVMDGFEKWKETFEANPPAHIEPGLDCYDCLEYYQTETWKACLLWMKEKLDCEAMPGDIEYFIDKELND